jgi:hypothetical protein
MGGQFGCFFFYCQNPTDFTDRMIINAVQIRRRSKRNMFRMSMCSVPLIEVAPLMPTAVD